MVAVLTVNRPRDLLQGRRLIASGRALDPARLANPELPLQDAAEGGGVPAGPR
jgi:3-phenylpropionate/trans-cinnamate dioxygenase ferredoxin reductase subunit